MTAAAKISMPPDAVSCKCGHRIFDGQVVRSRCVKPAEGIALCRCKEWVKVPVTLRAREV